MAAEASLVESEVTQEWNPNTPSFHQRMLVVAGQSGKVGKTALVVDLLSAFRDAGRGWTAVKITPYAESKCPVNGSLCDCGPDEHLFAVTEEGSASSQTDTSRFLAAGAKRAFWVHTKTNCLREAVPALARLLEPTPHIIVESNAILEFWRPAAALMVLDPSNQDFKASARQAALFADAFVLRSPFRFSQFSEWTIDSSSKPTFLQLLGEPLPAGVQVLAGQLLGLPPHLRSNHGPS